MFQTPTATVAHISKDDKYVYVEAATSGFPNGVDRIKWDLIDFFHEIPDPPIADEATGRTAKLEHNGSGQYSVRLYAYGPQDTRAGTTQEFKLSQVPQHSTTPELGGLDTRTLALLAAGGVGLVGIAAATR